MHICNGLLASRFWETFPKKQNLWLVFYLSLTNEATGNSKHEEIPRPLQ